MFLSAYHFDGDPSDLIAAYDRLNTILPTDALQFHACVVTESGIAVFDSCPSRAIAESFSDGPDFAQALAAAGLPTPRKDRIGVVHAAFVSGKAFATS